MLFSWLPSWKRRQTSEPGKPARTARLRVERLEAREVPAVAPWTSYAPRFGDKVDALISHLAPGTRDPVTFYRNLNGWISASIAPRVPIFASANTYLAQLAGDCTVRAHIFQAVAQRLGTPVRIVVLPSVPYQGMHMGVEVAPRGAWQFFDPSSGVYLASRRNPRNPLGLFQARALGRQALVMDPAGPMFLGAWSPARSFTYLPAKGNLMRWRGNPAFDLQATYFAAPVSIRPPTPLPPV